MKRVILKVNRDRNAQKREYVNDHGIPDKEIDIFIMDCSSPINGNRYLLIDKHTYVCLSALSSLEDMERVLYNLFSRAYGKSVREFLMDRYNNLTYSLIPPTQTLLHRKEYVNSNSHLQFNHLILKCYYLVDKNHKRPDNNKRMVCKNIISGRRL